MSDVILLSGNIQFKITLDPSVWIFDDRKIEFDKAFDETNEQPEEENENNYTKKMSEQWEKERAYGVNYPPVNESVKRLEKEKILTGTYVMPFAPFVEHAEPDEDAKNVEIVLKDGTSTTYPLSKVKDALLLFAKDGKPLKDDGPVHLYFRDGSNRNDPIKNIAKFIFK